MNEIGIRSLSSLLLIVLIVSTVTQSIGSTDFNTTVDRSASANDSSAVDRAQSVLQATLRLAVHAVWSLVRFCTLLLFPLPADSTLMANTTSFVYDSTARLPLAEKLVSLSPKEVSQFVAALNTTESTLEPTTTTATVASYAQDSPDDAFPTVDPLYAHFCSCPPSLPNLTHNYLDPNSSFGALDLFSNENCIYLPDTEVTYRCLPNHQADRSDLFTVNRLICARNASGHHEWVQPLDQLLTTLDDQVTMDLNLIAAERNVPAPASFHFLTCSKSKRTTFDYDLIDIKFFKQTKIYSHVAV